MTRCRTPLKKQLLKELLRLKKEPRIQIHRVTTDWKPGDAPGEDGLEGHADLPVQLPDEAFGPPTLDEVTELRRFRMALPMGSKKARDVVNTVMEFVLRLRTEGFHVGRIHSDQGHEFAGEFKTWARQRGIYLTKTPGDDR